MMSRSDSFVAAVEEQGRAGVDQSTREVPHRRLRAVEADREPAAREPGVAVRPVRNEAAAARLLVLLHATPLLGVAGVAALYRSSDGPRDLMFAVGMLLLLGAVSAFHRLRARLVARLALPAIRDGVPRQQALQGAELAADKLIRASLRFGGSSAEAKASRWPPIELG